MDTRKLLSSLRAKLNAADSIVQKEDVRGHIKIVTESGHQYLEELNDLNKAESERRRNELFGDGSRSDDS